MSLAPTLVSQPRQAGHAVETFRLSLWLPLTPIFWVLAPFVLLLAPLLLLAPPMWRMSPYVTVVTIGRVLLSLNGVDVDVETPDARIHIKIL